MDTEPMDDLQEILGLPKEKRKNHSLFHFKEKGNIDDARTKVEALISEFKKMTPLEFNKLKNPRLLETWERLNNSFEGLPGWESLIMASQADFRMGDDGNIVVAINPTERNKSRLMIRSFADRSMYKAGVQSVDHLYG